MNAAALSELTRRVTGLLELDAGLHLGALSAPGRGHRGMIFGRYLSAYIMVSRFDIPVEQAAHLLNRDRGTVTKALKIFRFLEGYQSWRSALDTLGDLCLRFVEYGAMRASAAAQVPAPVGRDKRNDSLPAWVRERYAIEIEAVGEEEVATEARATTEADSIFLSHPAVKAITADPALQKLLGELVVSVTISPPDDLLIGGAPILLVPPVELASGGVALRLVVKGDSPSQINAMLEARNLISRALLRAGYRLSGAAETFPARDAQGWRYVPLHISPRVA